MVKGAIKIGHAVDLSLCSFVTSSGGKCPPIRRAPSRLTCYLHASFTAGTDHRTSSCPAIVLFVLSRLSRDRRCLCRVKRHIISLLSVDLCRLFVALLFTGWSFYGFVRRTC